MTPNTKARELAERIMDTIRSLNENNGIWWSVEITSLLSEAMEEADKEGWRLGLLAGKDGIIEAVKNAYLKAAGVARKHHLPSGCCAMAMDDIAAAIERLGTEGER